MQNKENNFYHYDGPLPLGSVIAHNCGAAGLFVAPTDKEADFKITAAEVGAAYEIEVVYHGECILKSQASLDTEGRKSLGKEVLYRVRQFRGLEAHNEWGSLVGVRPTKLYHKLWDQLGNDELVAKELSSTYDVAPEVIARLAQIAELQRPYLEAATQTERMLSLYSGIPFCQSRCIYCSFPYGLIQDFPRLPDFVEAYLLDIANMRRIVERYQCKVDTLYMGGGTPTSLAEDNFATILTQLATLIEAGREFTVEAGRPDSGWTMMVPHYVALAGLKLAT